MTPHIGVIREGDEVKVAFIDQEALAAEALHECSRAYDAGYRDGVRDIRESKKYADRWLRIENWILWSVIVVAALIGAIRS